MWCGAKEQVHPVWLSSLCMDGWMDGWGDDRIRRTDDMSGKQFVYMDVDVEGKGYRCYQSSILLLDEGERSEEERSRRKPNNKASC